MKKLNIGFIGAGRIADMHVAGYENSKDARLYALCNRNRKASEAKMKAWKVQRHYTDYREMLNDHEIDAVEILTPHHLHEEMVMDAIKAKKHIALQKPMTISMESADRILKAVEDSGISFRITDNYVFYPPTILAKKMIDDGAIGTPINIRLKFISSNAGGWEVPSEAWAWRMKENAEGRPMQTFDHGHHLWSTAWFLMGEVERVVAWIDSLDGIVDCPSMVMWKYRSGTKYGICDYTHAADLNIPSKYYSNDEWIEITGSKGIIHVYRNTGNINSGPAVGLFKNQKWKYYSNVKSDWKEGFIGATKNFINTINGKAEPFLSGEQGREILRFAFAIQKSSQCRREVYLDEMDLGASSNYSKKMIRKEIRDKYPKKSILERLGIGGSDARYADQAKALTDELARKFDPRKVKDWEIKIGLKILPDSGVPEMRYKVIIESGKLTLEEGTLPDDASLTIKVPAGTWAALLLGKKRIETALLQGKFKYDGKTDDALKLRSSFGL